ncbi:MAG: glycosyltransferase family 2 protein [Muribaculaceae bacterium]|nr:glycosyltransferase family 2 protein [Muribaculaceae bacterium]
MDLTLAICVYNAEKYLVETLESVMAQTRGDFKLLIVDDCSTDGSVAAIRRFFEKHPREYELVELDRNRGICNARKTALEKASTKYILFVDADDPVKDTLVERLYEAAQEDKDVMAVTCWSRFIDMDGKQIAGGTFLGVRNKEEFNDKASRGKLFFMPIHTLFDRQIAIEAGGFVVDGFPDGKPRYQDFCEELDLWTRMSDRYKDGKYFKTVPEVLYYYRKSDGLSSNHFNMLLKMRYTKHNVRSRRAGKPEKTFSEFYASLSEQDLKALRDEATAADCLRNGVILLKKGNIVKGPWLILRSITTRPAYFFDKLKHNLRLGGK